MHLTPMTSHKTLLLRLVAEVLLSNSPIRFSEALNDAVDALDEEEIQEAQEALVGPSLDDEDEEE